MFNIKEPRYHDGTVLLAPWKVVPHKDQQINIEKGYYKGDYTLKYDEMIGCGMTTVKTKKGTEVQMICVPLDKLIKKGEANEEEE